MMNNISVVIIAKNESENISDCIASAKIISIDIIMADTGSRDNTLQLAEAAGARCLSIEWSGFGNARNEASKYAANDWIFAMDADERITEELAQSINTLKLENPRALYGVKRRNFLAFKAIRFGEWSRDRVFRLYNRKFAQWNLLAVHEYISGTDIQKQMLPGKLLHYTMKDVEEYERKTILYAQLSAEKYKANGQRATALKRFISPVFSFIQNYFFRLGFLDGKEGLIIAKGSAKYIYLKYRNLYLLKKNG